MSEKPGPIALSMAQDHSRLDGLMKEALGIREGVRAKPFWDFRQGLLRHIGIEETVLLPAIKSPTAHLKSLAAQLRLDHGALTNLLVPEPTREIAAALCAILLSHNLREEEPGGFYSACDALPKETVGNLMGKIAAAPELPLRPYSKRPQALEAAKRAMRRAGYEWEMGTVPN